MTLKKPTHQIVATVLGAGTMGAGIAAHLAAAGCRTYLLDIVPRDCAPEQRSSIAQGALKALPKSRPPALMSPSVLSRMIAGNLEDDLERACGHSDLVIEAVVERLDVKLGLFKRVAAASRPDTIFATNTSGIPIDAIAEGLSDEAKKRFLGLHFFNPPRFMHLLEVIPGSGTDAEVVAEASAFCDVALGKGIVPCRDTPNFIGNRIGIAEMLLTFAARDKYGLSIEEVDFLNGPLLGRPNTGSFRLGDLVGIDVLGHVVENLQAGLCGDPKAKNYDPLYDLMKVPPVVAALCADGRLGDKTGSGFYKKSRGKDGSREILVLDVDTLQYRPQVPARFSELEPLLKKASLPKRVQLSLRGEGRGSDFLREVMLSLFNYAAQLTGTICETPAEIDKAMRWGYGWQKGPFELLDDASPAWVTEQLEARGQEPAAALARLLAEKGRDGRFYQESTPPRVFVPNKGDVTVAQPPGAIFLNQKAVEGVITENPTARLIDLGDGVACLEFRSKANILDDGVVQLIQEAPELLHQKGYQAMVLGNQADHFCRGANLVHIAGLIQKADFGGVEAAIKQLQDAFMGLRHGPIPVVAAPIGQALGGGTEACLHCAEIQAGADLFMGLVEVGVGVLPAGGGLKEIARRASQWAKQVEGTDPYEWVKRGFESVATARVSGSAFEAKELGYLSSQDGVTFHRARVIADAKKRALSLAIKGWIPPDPEEPISVVGAPGGANMMMGLRLFGWGGYATEYDQHIGKKIVFVLSGGMRPSAGTVSAQQLLDLEREAFVSLCGEEKTLARITHMLTTKKPLRN